jgi:hypothetical protein
VVDSGLEIYRGKRKNDQNADRKGWLFIPSSEDPSTCPRRIFIEYSKLLDAAGVQPTDPLFYQPGKRHQFLVARLCHENPLPSDPKNKSKLSDKPAGKNGPFSWVKKAAKLIGLSDSKKYTPNSYRVTAATVAFDAG